MSGLKTWKQLQDAVVFVVFGPYTPRFLECLHPHNLIKIQEAAGARLFAHCKSINREQKPNPPRRNTHCPDPEDDPIELRHWNLQLRCITTRDQRTDDDISDGCQYRLTASSYRLCATTPQAVRLPIDFTDDIVLDTRMRKQPQLLQNAERGSIIRTLHQGLCCRQDGESTMVRTATMSRQPSLP